MDHEVRNPLAYEVGQTWSWMVSLDRRLAAAITKVSHGETGRVLTQMSTAALNSGQIARGRVLPATVFSYYASGSSGQVLYDMSHLQTLVMRDNNLEALHNTGNMALSEFGYQACSRGTPILVL